MTSRTPRRKALRRTLAGVLAAGALTAAASLFPTAAQAAGATITLCTWTAAPNGFVDISFQTDFNCGDIGSSNRWSHTAQYIGGDPVGTQIQACTSSAPPEGWYATRSAFYTSRCTADVGHGFPSNTVVLQRFY